MPTQGDVLAPEMETCRGCGMEHPPSDLVEAYDYNLYRFCPDCRDECDYCGHTFRWIGDHQWFCHSCHTAHCGEEDYHYCDECDTRRCEYCGPCEGRSASHAVHQWDYRPPSYRPKGNYRSEVLLGMELEVCGYEDPIVRVVQSIDPDEDHLYMKEDGSISGVEIVTHPMTLAWSRTFPFGQMLQGLRNGGCSVNEGYGLHVHVSRRAFRKSGTQSTSHQMVWLMFLYRNSAQLEQLARRTSDRWASFRPPVRGELRRKSHDCPAGDDRYVAVNCRNDRTYELRFFKSTLDEQEMRAALEFADASVEYTRGIKSPDILRGNALSWDAFASWVRSRNYPNLEAEIRKNRYLRPLRWKTPEVEAPRLRRPVNHS